ncbi:MAG: hypothetical protein IT337_13940 [Thermomicrobiales bacterium]|nr:hypothetical protein [Thermomicrobiales bacterium]
MSFRVDRSRQASTRIGLLPLAGIADFHSQLGLLALESLAALLTASSFLTDRRQGADAAPEIADVIGRAIFVHGAANAGFFATVGGSSAATAGQLQIHREQVAPKKPSINHDPGGRHRPPDASLNARSIHRMTAGAGAFNTSSQVTHWMLLIMTNTIIVGGRY